MPQSPYSSLLGGRAPDLTERGQVEVVAARRVPSMVVSAQCRRIRWWYVGERGARGGHVVVDDDRWSAGQPPAEQQHSGGRRTHHHERDQRGDAVGGGPAGAPAVERERHPTPREHGDGEDRATPAPSTP